MSVDMLRYVLRAEIRPAGVKLVAVALAWRFNDDEGVARPGKADIAKMAGGVTVDRVKQALSALKAAGVIEVAKSGGGGAGTAATNRYRFCSEWVSEQAAKEDALLGKPATHDRVSRLAVPDKPAYPKRNGKEKERPTAFPLKAAQAAKQGRAAVGRSSLNPNTQKPKPMHNHPNSQQPLPNMKSPTPYVTPLWMDSRATIEAKGVELGLGAFCEATEPAGTASAFSRYIVRVMTAAGLVKPRKPKPALRRAA